EFVSKMKLGAEALAMGDPAAASTTLGPMVSRQQMDKVLSYYKLAEAEGATVITGGKAAQLDGALAGGNWIEPTIWTGLSERSAVVRDEIFGPCTHIAPFDDEAEVITLANDTKYGLCASVWTENAATAHRVSQQLEVGIVWANCWFLRDLRTAFGGAKQSGIGREGGVHSLEFYT
ncbi:MAG: aldehyde dehydrogenase family protein, partial [Cellvibrionaceae bacterium]|nr:aldehyde dehydrogenase family protein [Cellvibrionaceae bacterium]